MRNTALSSLLLLSVSLCHTSGAQAQTAIVLPAGTAIHVRTIDSIDIDSARQGAKFKASLADPVMSHGGAVLIPRGAPVQLSAAGVNKSGRLKGRDRIDLKVDSITFNGRTRPVVSSVAESKGTRKGRRALRNSGIGAGAGAIVGGIVGGGAGAAIGALAGGGGGAAVSAATGGKHLTIPPETVLSFQLQAPLRVN
jgi:hypothetical protein